MCVAIPFGHQDNENSSRLWNWISATPLRLLGFGAVFQAVLLGMFWLALETPLLNGAELLLSPGHIILFISLSAISLFLMTGWLMTYYPLWMGNGEIEYLHYAGLFYIGNLSLLLFYAGVFFSQGLLISALVLYLAILSFAFKPVWWIGYWADRHDKAFARLVNFSLAMVLAGLMGFILSIITSSSQWLLYSLLVAAMQWLIPMAYLSRSLSKNG